MYLEEVVKKLTHPEEYVTGDYDVPIMQIITEGEPENPTLILLGYDDEKYMYYLVVEDCDVSEDYYCYEKSLEETFCNIIKDLVSEGEC